MTVFTNQYHYFVALIGLFRLLCFKSALSREMFQKMSIVEGFRTNQCCDLNMHAKIICDLFDSIVSDLRQSSKIVQARCMDIGGSHVQMNEKCCGALWDQLGECLAEVITKVDCVRAKRECTKAWIMLISYVVGGMFSEHMKP
uniref:GLOBIN domain-containing protein n=1 Tax=Angiostrongylus cantonensis TaxID=6313 RepID=A0A0K0D3U4_ANGCA